MWPYVVAAFCLGIVTGMSWVGFLIVRLYPLGPSHGLRWFRWLVSLRRRAFRLHPRLRVSPSPKGRKPPKPV